VIAVWSAAGASAHASLVSSNPEPGATLGATPTEVTVTVSERPVAALSSVTVTGARGAAFQTGAPAAAAGDPLTLTVPVRPLGRGVYTVKWRVDSAVDGHATTGAYQFGVQASPAAGGSTERTTTKPVSSTLELVGRWVFLVGLVALLGAASAGVARFGGPDRGVLVLAAGGWLLAAVGLIVLADAQRRNAGSSLAALLRSPVGHALIWRAVAISIAGAALLVALRVRSLRRAALGAAGAAALAAVIIHVANGHAAASRWPSAATVTFQAAHFAVAGVWIGGLAALLIGIRGAPTPEKSRAIRRFSIIAAAGLGVIVVTGVVRAISELRSFDQLFSTGYGRAVLAKLALVALIAAVAARNRGGGVRMTGSDLGPLRRNSRVELTLAAAALGIAALLGTLAPPVSGRATGLAGLEASGADAGRTVRVRLQALSDQPGPNRFTAQVSDYASSAPVQGASVRLLFTPLDDPGVASSTLGLAPAAGGRYVGSGKNMSFDGRWAVRVLIARAGGSAEVPLELDPVGPPQSLTIERIAGQAPTFTKLVGIAGFIRISPHPDRAGRSELFVNFYTAATGDEQPVRGVVVTAAAGHGPVRQLTLRGVGPGSFIGEVDLAPGHTEIAVVARTTYHARMRSVFDLLVPGR
jgi:copper transport protein